MCKEHGEDCVRALLLLPQTILRCGRSWSVACLKGSWRGWGRKISPLFRLLRRDVGPHGLGLSTMNCRNFSPETWTLKLWAGLKSTHHKSMWYSKGVEGQPYDHTSTTRPCRVGKEGNTRQFWIFIGINGYIKSLRMFRKLLRPLQKLPCLLPLQLYFLFVCLFDFQLRELGKCKMCSSFSHSFSHPFLQ